MQGTPVEAPPTRPAAAPYPPFRCISTTNGRGAAWVHLSGELDMAVASQFTQTLRNAQQQARCVVVDLRELTFIDSSGLHAIVSASSRGRQHGHRFVVVRGTANVDRLFTLVGAAADVELVDITDAARIA